SEKGSTRIVEVTGTNGKTTVCKMMAKVALDQGLKLLVHDSTGTMLGDDECEVLAEGLSITPANTLRAWRLAEERGFKPDLCIFEVSLGGTGAADVGVVTGIYNNYDVSFMVNAFNSKLQMALNMGDRGILVLNGDNKPSRRFAHAFRGLCNVFGFEGGLQVKGRLLSYDLNEGMLIGGEIQGLNALGSSKVDGPFNLKLGAQLFGRHQALNALAALTAMLSLNLKVDEVCSSLSEFEGVEGRSKASFEDWGLMIDCRNRGIAIPVVASVLGEAIGLKRLNLIKKLIVVIGGSGRVACEIADVNRLSAELKRLSEVDLCVLYGALSFRLSGLGVKCQVFNSLEESISYARSEASKSPRSMVVICSDET
ncbi:MAG: Mur ligase family protein, partial [Desulfurococcaceae archaeon]